MRNNRTHRDYTTLATLLLILLTFVGSWLFTCSIIKLITLCFGWNFTWLLGTGVWLILWVLKGIFGK